MDGGEEVGRGECGVGGGESWVGVDFFEGGGRAGPNTDFALEAVVAEGEEDGAADEAWAKDGEGGRGRGGAIQGTRKVLPV